MTAVLWMKSSCTTCRNLRAKLAELGIMIIGSDAGAYEKLVP